MSVVESKKRCKAAEGRSGVTVKEVGGSMEGFNLVDRGRLPWKRRERTILLIVRRARSTLPFC